MKPLPQLALFCALTASLIPAAKRRTPQFDDYRVSRLYTGETKPPNFGDPGQYQGAELRCLGTDPTGYSDEHPNFAGQYVVDTCTCGTGCHFLFMWDAISGKLFYRNLPFKPLNIGPYLSSSPQSTQVTYSGEEYRLDSSLMVIEACFGETCDCAKRFYRWTGSEFKLILKQPVQLPGSCVRRK